MYIAINVTMYCLVISALHNIFLFYILFKHIQLFQKDKCFLVSPLSEYFL